MTCYAQSTRPPSKASLLEAHCKREKRFNLVYTKLQDYLPYESHNTTTRLVLCLSQYFQHKELILIVSLSATFIVFHL